MVDVPNRYVTIDNDNKIWNDKTYLATAHIDKHIRNIYNTFEDDLNDVEILKNNFPHGCILNSLWELIVNSKLDINYIDSFEYINFSYTDLKILYQSDDSFDNINNHINNYINRIVSMMNSYCFSLNDMCILSRKSGICSVNLCGNFELYEDKLKLYNKKQWQTNDGYKINYISSNCYWRSYPYFNEPMYPKMIDFECQVKDLNVILFSESNWIQAMIYVKLFDSDELESSLYEYRSNIRNFLNSDNTNSHHWDQWSKEHKKLEKVGLKVWIVKYDDLIARLKKISSYYNISLTNRKKITYNLETEEKYFKQFNENLSVKFNYDNMFNKKYNIQEPDNQMSIYMEEYLSQSHFLEQIEVLNSIPISLHRFLTSDIFLKYNGPYDNLFKILINNRYYKKLINEERELLLEQYTLSEIDYMLLGDDNIIYNKLNKNINCPYHEVNNNLYYKMVSEEELNDLECGKI